jgi:hypothetical protein
VSRLENEIKEDTVDIARRDQRKDAKSCKLHFNSPVKSKEDAMNSPLNAGTPPLLSKWTGIGDLLHPHRQARKVTILQQLQEDN